MHEQERWRREGDLNSRGKIPHDFQSCAIPGYAISAGDLTSNNLNLSLLMDEADKSYRSD